MLFRDESASKKVCYLCKKKVPHDEWNSGDHRKKCAKRREESAFGRGGGRFKKEIPQYEHERNSFQLSARRGQICSTPA